MTPKNPLVSNVSMSNAWYSEVSTAFSHKNRLGGQGEQHGIAKLSTYVNVRRSKLKAQARFARLPYATVVLLQPELRQDQSHEIGLISGILCRNFQT